MNISQPSQILPCRLLRFLVFRCNFLYLCFFIFSLLCLFTEIKYILTLCNPGILIPARSP